MIDCAAELQYGFLLFSLPLSFAFDSSFLSYFLKFLGSSDTYLSATWQWFPFTFASYLVTSIWPMLMTLMVISRSSLVTCLIRELPVAAMLNYLYPESFDKAYELGSF